MAKEIENEEIIETAVDQVTASQKLDEKARKEREANPTETDLLKKIVELLEKEKKA